MNIEIPPADAVPQAPIAAPDVATTINTPPTASSTPEAQPDTVAAAPSTPQPTPPQAAAAATRPDGPVNMRRRRPQMPLVGLTMDRPLVAEHDLLMQGSINLTSRAGIIVEVPINTTLSGTLSAAFLPLAQQQLESVLDLLLVKPATVAFISYIEDVKAMRKAENDKAKQARAAVFGREQEAQNAPQNRKDSHL